MVVRRRIRHLPLNVLDDRRVRPTTCVVCIQLNGRHQIEAINVDGILVIMAQHRDWRRFAGGLAQVTKEKGSVENRRY